MKTKLAMLSAAIGLAFVAGSASAGITWYGPPTYAATSFQDDDLEWLYHDEGQDGKLGVGDQLVAVFEIMDTFSVPSGSSAPITGGELTGISAIEVIAKTGGTDGAGTNCSILFPCNFQFGPVNQGMDAILSDLGLAPLGLGDGVMAAGWWDETPDLNVLSVNCTSLADCAAKAADGVLWEVDGFTDDEDQYWFSSGSPTDDLSLIKAGQDSAAFGQYNFGLVILYNNTGRELTEQNCTPICNIFPGGDDMIGVIGSGQILGGAGLSDTLGAFGRSDFDFQKAPTAGAPEPGTLLLLAAGLLGLGQTARRRMSK